LSRTVPTRLCCKAAAGSLISLLSLSALERCFCAHAGTGAQLAYSSAGHSRTTPFLCVPSIRFASETEFSIRYKQVRCHWTGNCAYQAVHPMTDCTFTCALCDEACTQELRRYRGACRKHIPGRLQNTPQSAPVVLVIRRRCRSFGAQRRERRSAATPEVKRQLSLCMAAPAYRIQSRHGVRSSAGADMENRLKVAIIPPITIRLMNGCSNAITRNCADAPCTHILVADGRSQAVTDALRLSMCACPSISAIMAIRKGHSSARDQPGFRRDRLPRR